MQIVMPFMMTKGITLNEIHKSMKNLATALLRYEVQSPAQPCIAALCLSTK